MVSIYLATAGMVRCAAQYAATTWRPALGVRLGFASTHTFINRQALRILANDGWVREAGFLAREQDALHAGACRADGGLGCLGHYFNPRTGRGLWGYLPATTMMNHYFKRALKAWLAGKHRRALYYLGLATHLLQDACVPQHTHGSPGCGHGTYERWVRQWRGRYGVIRGGLYRPDLLQASDWLVFNSRVAYNYLDLVAHPDREAGYHRATADLLPLAQRSTAGFWLYFLTRAGALPGQPAAAGLQVA